MEDFAQWASREVLLPDAGRTEGTPEGHFEVGAIRHSDGEDSGAGGMRLCANGGQKLKAC